MKELFLSTLVIMYAFSCRANTIELNQGEFSKEIAERAYGKKKASENCTETHDKIRGESTKSCTVVKLGDDKKEKK